MPEAEPSRHLAEAPLGHDYPCRGCGYNLRGLGRAGDCPECGQSIALSLANQLLAGADPAWVRRVYRGAGLVLWAVLATIILPFGGGCFFSISNENGWHWRITAWVILAWLAVGWMLAALGTWLLTSSANDTLRPYPHPALRWAARLGIALGPALLMLFLLGEMYAGARSPHYQLYVLTLYGGAILLGLGKTALYLCYRQLAQRMKEPGLASSASFLAAILALGTFNIAIVTINAHSHHPSYLNDSVIYRLLARSLPFIILIAMIWQLALAIAFRDKLWQALPHHRRPKRENNFGAGAM